MKISGRETLAGLILGILISSSQIALAEDTKIRKMSAHEQIIILNALSNMGFNSKQTELLKSPAAKMNREKAMLLDMIVKKSKSSFIGLFSDICC